eukprot:753796-Hanusia_phi.AAC.3
MPECSPTQRKYLIAETSSAPSSPPPSMSCSCASSSSSPPPLKLRSPPQHRHPTADGGRALEAHGRDSVGSIVGLVKPGEDDSDVADGVQHVLMGPREGHPVVLHS